MKISKKRTKINDLQNAAIRFCIGAFQGATEADYVKYHNRLFMISKMTRNREYYVMDVMKAYEGKNDLYHLNKNLDMAMWSDTTCLSQDKRQCIQRIKEYHRKCHNENKK